MAGAVTEKDIKALEKKISNLEGIIVKLGKGQQNIDLAQMNLIKNHSKRFDVVGKRIDLLEKKIKAKG